MWKEYAKPFVYSSLILGLLSLPSYAQNKQKTLTMYKNDGTIQIGFDGTYRNVTRDAQNVKKYLDQLIEKARREQETKQKKKPLTIKIRLRN